MTPYVIRVGETTTIDGKYGDRNHSWSLVGDAGDYIRLSNTRRRTVTVRGLQVTEEPVAIRHTYEVNEGFGWRPDYQEYTETIWITVSDGYTITFDANRGSGTVPDPIEAQAGTEVTLPDASLRRNGYVFVGWSLNDNANGDAQYKPGNNGTVYPAGSTFMMPERDVTLYATWSREDVDAQFFIRLDGTIPTEPQGHEASEYTSAINIDDAIKIATFYFNPTDGVDARLNSVPSTQQIQEVYPSYNPNTQYVLWYVIKAENTWHVDGVLLSREKVNLAYDPNAPAGTWSNMPDGAQYDPGDTATVSTTTTTTPRRPWSSRTCSIRA